MDQQEQQPPNQPCQVPWDRSDPHQQELTAILESLKHDPALMGVFSLGKDGVMRSLTADREVVDAVGLSQTQIATFLGRLPDYIRDTYQVSEGADGTKVPRDKWFHPDKGLLPEPLVQEARDKIEEDWKQREQGKSKR